MNIFVVWLLTGIWHGANWTFILWGLLNFVLLIIERFTHIDKKMGILNHLYTMFFVMLGWVLFRSDSIREACTYICGMFGFGTTGFIDGAFTHYLQQYGIYYALGILCCFPLLKNIDRSLSKNKIYAVLYAIIMTAILAVSIMFIFSNAYSPFIYSNF